jgi:hypothetical protein
MDLYKCAGVGMWQSQNKFNLLLSYAFMQNVNEDVTSWIYNIPNVNILLDCGAYTAFTTGKVINLSKYIEYCKKWKHRLYRYCALDKLADSKQTKINLNIMLKAGLRPMPIFVHGDCKEHMEYLYSISDCIALGGMKIGHGGGYYLPYVNYAMNLAAGRKVHWFGQANQLLLNTYKPFSCDASTSSRGRRWGLMKLYKDAFTPVLEYTYPTFVAKRLPLWVHEIIEQLGFTYEELLDANNWKGIRQKASIVGRSSFFRYANDCEKYLNTRYFIADFLGGLGELLHVHHKLNHIAYCKPEIIPKALS